MQSMTRDIAAGAAGGLAGGIVMSGAMVMAEHFGLEPMTPPVKVGRWASYHAGNRERLKEDVTVREEAFAETGHLVASAALGAAFGALRGQVALPPVVSGLAFGLGLYAINYGALGPALTVTKKPWNVSPVQHAERAAIHAVFGMVIGLVANALSKGGSPNGNGRRGRGDERHRRDETRRRP